MAAFTKLPSGKWRVQVRRKGRYLGETFILRKDAELWARRIEREIDLGQRPRSRKVEGVKTFGELIDLHLGDMNEVGKPLGRSKSFCLELLTDRLGAVRLADLDRERLIEFGRERASEGAGPVTLGIDLGYVRTLLAHGAAVHGLPFSPEPVELARIALKRLGLVGKGAERDRRPTQDEIDALLRFFSCNPMQQIPVDRIIRFAIATAMRQEEICSIEWTDVRARAKTLLIRNRKDPRNKQGNNQEIPLLAVSGYDAWAILNEQQQATGGGTTGRIFPYNGRSVGAAFRRGCGALGINDLHFHDLRHEGTSRLFEAGFSIEQVSIVTGHRDWKMLRRYTHLKAEHLHILAAKLTGAPAAAA